MRIALSRLTLIVLVLATVGCDRVTKHIAWRTLSDASVHTYLNGAVRLQLAENTGGFLSLGAGWSAGVRTTVFTIGNTLMLTALIVFAIRDRWSGAGLAGATLFVAGGVSNLADRIVRGSVVDFLNVGVGDWRTGVFNVADVAIMLGVLLTLTAIVRRPEPASERSGNP